MSDVQLSDFLTLEASAARADCSIATIWRRVAEGTLPTRRVLGRVLIAKDDVDALAAAIVVKRRRRRAGAP